MDPLDFAIYRALSPGGEARFWAGRRLIDPGIPARAIAEQVGISENGVRARLKSLDRQGFLRGRAVTPNPSLFGVRVFVAEIPVKDPGEVERLYRDLALVEGVIFARDTLDEGDRALHVHFVSESDSTTRRRVSLLRRLAAPSQAGAPQLYRIPECDREPSPLDWRILQAVCRAPGATIAETAGTVKISLKTAARRLHELVDSKACWWTPGPDAEEFPLALIQITVSERSQRDAIAGKVHEAAPIWMPVASDGLGVDPETSATVISGLVPADAPTLLERTVSKLADYPGVVRVRRTFALGSRSYPGWFTDRLAEHVPTHG
ncbi:MAG TPA: winged helix-turn-helix transcriptional regulator [Thermoplasmata archaeon]|nr:winged helix-turn-helix transcriptional regulator [Thermoplasmata archaeon]